MTTQRNDIHRPSQVVPADYTELFIYAHATTVDGWPVPGFNISLLCAQRTGRAFYAASDANPGEVQPFKDDNGKPYPMAACHKGGNCDTCGAYHVHGSVFLHIPTGECIAIGWQCAEKMDLAMDLAEIQRMKGARQELRLSVVTKAKRRAALRLFVQDTDRELRQALRVDHYITQDIRGKLIRNAAKYGAKLSEKQAALVMKLAREAAQPKVEEVHVPAPVSEKRQTIEGVVVSCRTNDWGNLRMTVKVTTDAGVWLANGTCPAAISDGIELGNSGLRGCTVRFDAKMTDTGSDEHFAFFKRPTKARVVALGEEQQKHLDSIKADLQEAEGQDWVGEEWKQGRRDLIARMETLN